MGTISTGGAVNTHVKNPGDRGCECDVRTVGVDAKTIAEVDKTPQQGDTIGNGNALSADVNTSPHRADDGESKSKTKVQVGVSLGSSECCRVGRGSGSGESSSVHLGKQRS